MSNANIQQEFSKLDVFIENSDKGIFIAEVNSIENQMRIIEYLEASFVVEQIDFNLIKDSFVGELKSHTNEDNVKIYYNFIYDNVDYDIIRTLNLAREVIKENGKVVFLLPSFLVWRIQYEEPNLRDYVICFFDFNEPMDLPFVPEFALDKHVFKAKTERAALKELYLKGEEVIPNELDGFFRYMDQFEYKKMNRIEMQYVLDMMWMAFSNIKESKLQSSEEQYLNLEEALCRKVAWSLAKQKYFDKAIEVFDLLEILRQSERKSAMLRLYQYEGKAYCWYHKGEYQEAKKELLMMLDVLNEYENDFSSWKARIYNDCACCMMKEGMYENAMGVLEQSYQILLEAGEMNLRRKQRYFYNRMLLILSEKKCVYPYIKEWEDFVEELRQSQNLVLKAKVATLDAWLKGFVEGNLISAYMNLNENLNDVRNIFPENDMEIARMHYTFAQICYLMGKQELYNFHLEKYRNISKNRR